MKEVSALPKGMEKRDSFRWRGNRSSLVGYPGVKTDMKQ